MELLHPHCAGLDLHKETVVACIRHMVDSKVTTEVKTFKTTTQELMELSDWLSVQGARQVTNFTLVGLGNHIYQLAAA